MIQNLIFGILFFLKRLFWVYNFSIFVHTFQWSSSDFFKFQIFQQIVSKSTKASEKDHPFCNTVLLKKPHSFYEP